MLLVAHRSYVGNWVIVSVVSYVDECYGQTTQKWSVEADPSMTISQSLQAL